MQQFDDLDDLDDLDDIDDVLIEAATQAEAHFANEDAFDDSPQPTKRRRVQRIQLDGNTSEDEIEDQVNTFRRPLNVNNSRRNASLPTSKLDIGSRPTSLLGKGLTRKTPFVTSHDENSLDIDEDSEPEECQSGKRKRRVHVSNRELNLNGIIQTQPTNGSSSPWRLRGPIWQKKAPETQSNVLGANFVYSVAPNHPPQRSATTSTIISKATATLIEDAPASFDAAQELADLPSDAFSSSEPSRTPARNQRVAAPINGLRQTTLFGRDAANVPASQVNKRRNWPLADKNEPPSHHKLDVDALKTWLYPTNLGSIRDYQFNIVQRGLFHNLLVALPTGLGKTFIAAAIMLNWFRWTKEAQIVFVAPTKPLVAQQVEACFGIAGIPRSQTTMLTGDVAPALRAQEWINKRVFFMTPHTLINDLKTGICDPKRLVLIVVDEAHRATGNHANVEVVKFVRRFNESFRVLALTATPGSDVESVQKVIDALDISRVEIRTEQSLDIRQYVHQRQVETEVFDVSEEMEHVMNLFSKAVQPVLNIITSQGAYWTKDPLALTPFGLTKGRQQWMSSEAGRRAPQGLKGMINSVFTVLASLAHGIELLKYHGIGPFYHNMARFRTETQSTNKSKYRTQINKDEHFEKMMQTVRVWINKADFVGHPKLEFLRDVVLAHFTGASERGTEIGPSSTRIMIFAHFRDSAEMIVRVLGRLGDMVRAHVFVGQATSKESEGMDQKKQLEIITQFKNGVYNTLVATSIGEEGLDIGEVDLIICYDSKASPIRMLQRMGRTGRKRSGKIILLQLRGKEEQDAAKAKDTYEKMQVMIADGGHFNFHDDRSRRIVPKDIQPAVDKREVEIPWENTQAANGNSFLPVPTSRRAKMKRPPKKFHMPDGVKTGFTSASRLSGDQSDYETPQNRSKPQKQLNGIIELQPIPTLAEVCLTNAEENELNRQYLQINDEEEDMFISKPSLTSHPREQRSLRRTKFVGHGQRTTVMVKMLGTIQDIVMGRHQDYNEHLHISDVEGVGLADDASDSNESSSESAFEPPRKPSPHQQPRKVGRRRRISDYDMDAQDAEVSSPPPSSARWRLPSQAVTLGSDTSGSDAGDDEEPDSELADFVVDDAEPLELLSSFDSLKSSLSTELRAISSPQKSLRSTQDDDDDLPEVSALFAKAAPKKGSSLDSSGVLHTMVAQVQRRNRRVVEDSSSQ